MTVTKEGLKEAFIKAGLKQGDTVMVHSDITGFGLVENFTPKKQLKTFYEAFMEVIGDEGTLCVPAYFYEYAREGIPFDVKLSPVSKELGKFSSFINSLDGSYRSYNPIVSIAAVGKNAKELCSLSNIHSTGVNSVWDKFYNHNVKLFQIGISRGLYITYQVYIEYRAGVPYFYTKLYDIPVFDNGNKVLDYTLACVRYLDYDVDWDVAKFLSLKEEMIERNVLNHVVYNKGNIFAFEAQSLFDYYSEKIANDMYFMLKNKPGFVKGQIPFDCVYNK